jgi:hypothetical protein
MRCGRGAGARQDRRTRSCPKESASPRVLPGSVTFYFFFAAGAFLSAAAATLAAGFLAAAALPETVDALLDACFFTSGYSYSRDACYISRSDAQCYIHFFRLDVATAEGRAALETPASSRRRRPLRHRRTRRFLVQKPNEPSKKPSNQRVAFSTGTVRACEEGASGAIRSRSRGCPPRRGPLKLGHGR